MRTILVGYDGSVAGERALTRAADIAQAFSARLVVASVSALPSAPVPLSTLEATPALVLPAATGPITPGGVAPPSEPEAGPQPEELAQHQLERARMSLEGRNIETEYVVELGEPAERLLELADRHDADVIVVGSREHGFLDRLLGDPVDAAVAKRSRRDVLLVH